MKKERPVLVNADELDKLIDGLDLKAEQKDRLKARWLNYVLWWNSRADDVRGNYFALRSAVVIAGAFVPALVGLRELNVWGEPAWIFGAASIVASLVVAICTGPESLFAFGEIWREKRAAAELIKIEGFRFFQQTGPYRTMAHETAYHLFTERVEDLIEREIKDYTVAVTPNKQPRADKGNDRAG
jgi:hypothetical protein